MYFIYNVLLTICFILYIPVLLAKMCKGGVAEVREKLGDLSPDMTRKDKSEVVLWIHGVSVGETVAASPLVKELKKSFPDCRVVFSTVTKTGREIARRLIDTDDSRVCLIYFPFDLPWAVKKALSRVQPDLIVIMETELWPNFIKTAHELGSKVLLANCRISRRSAIGYRLLGPFFRDVLKHIDAFIMQSQEDLRSILTLGVAQEKAFNYGNTKYDIGCKDFDPVLQQRLKKELQVEDATPILVVGSSHANEEELLIPLFKRIKAEYEDFLMILAPRHPERLCGIERLYQKAGISTVRRTELRRQRRTAPVILVDTIGELFHVYSLADLVFVGGSLVNCGGHNILEPAVYQKLIFVGPYMNDFTDILSLFQKHKACVQVQNVKELEEGICYYLKNREEAATIALNALRIVDENKGAAKRINKLIAEILSRGKMRGI